MKKILSVLLAMAMIFSVMAAGVVNASAASPFAGAKTLDKLDTISVDKVKEVTIKYYKIKLSSPGTITFRCTNYTSGGWTTIALLDSDGNKVLKESKTINELSVYVEKKGTYYIKLGFDYRKYVGSGSIEDFYYTFKSDAKPTISIGVYMEPGDTLNVAALASNYDGKVTWKTTKKAVATISKGKIKAKSAGKARIRAYMDNGEYAEIVVIVKDEDDD